MIELALGLIGIGKPWGHVNPVVPAERDAFALLECALELDIRYFDSAPSYGVAERRLGAFLRGLGPRREELTIATKFGEHWDFDRGEPFVDHSYGALRRSLDGSLELLGRIDILQLHKTTPDVLRSLDLERAWDYARSLGITRIGASVSDLESAALTIANPAYTVLQLPYNSENPRFADAIDSARERHMHVAVNRPFAMGKLLYGEAPLNKAGAFRFVLDRGFDGVVLSGTKSIRHLEENVRSFREALVK